MGIKWNRGKIRGRARDLWAVVIKNGAEAVVPIFWNGHEAQHYHCEYDGCVPVTWAEWVAPEPPADLWEDMQWN